MMARGLSVETQSHHSREEEEEEGKRFSSSFSPLVVKERCFDFTISGRKDDGDLAETTTWDIPSGVDFHEWQRASALAKKDFEKKEEEKSKKNELAEEKEERKSVVPRLSRPPHRVLETLEEEEEEEQLAVRASTQYARSPAATLTPVNSMRMVEPAMATVCRGPSIWLGGGGDGGKGADGGAGGTGGE